MMALKGGTLMNKVLVCITIQENSKRLMQKGFELTQTLGGELHILHIRQGDTIFETPNSSHLFEELFVYGSELGGQVHFLCSSNITNTISGFIQDNAISHLIIGKAPTEFTHASNIAGELEDILEHIKVITIDRV